MSRHCPSAEALDGGEDVVCALRPNKGLGRVIVVVDELGNGGFQGRNTAVNASLDLACGQLCEEAFDLVEPGGPRWGQVSMPVGPLGEPVADPVGLMGGVIVHDDMNIEVLRYGSLDPIEEPPELGRAMSPIALADDPPGSDVEGGEQGRDAIPCIVVGVSLDLAGTHWQNWLATIERLDLAFLINAEHHSALGRRDIKPDNVSYFFNKQRIGR